MSYTGVGKKDRRRKAFANLPGQMTLDGQELAAPRLTFKIPPGVHTLFLGLGPGLESAKRGHYFPGKNNYFWKLFFNSGIWPNELTSDDDDQITAGGFGLADVISRPTLGSVHPTKAEFLAAKQRVRSIVGTHRPRLVVFVGLRAYRTFLRRDKSKINYGLQEGMVEGAKVFVLPSTSGASAGETSYDEKLDWFRKLKDEIDKVRGPA